jgi:FRG domain/SET domain
MEIVANQAENWGFPEKDQNRPLFRGHASLGWKLRPSSLRGRQWNTGTCDDENESIEEFLTKAPGLGGSVAATLSLWDGYFLMQHYSVPTRLLDWTESVLVAAYFAVSAKAIDNDAAIWMLDPYELNSWNPDFGSSTMNSPGFVGNQQREVNKVNKWLPLCGGKKFDDVPQYPIAIYPAYFSRRIENQRSAFTIHGSKPGGLEELWRKGGVLLRIVIPGQKAKTFRGMLRDMGVNTATVFPDAEGLGRYLAERWGPATFRQPHKGVFVRLRPSKVHKGGVGVFAIRPIPKGTNIFAGESERLVWTDADKIPRERSLKRLYADFGVLRDGRYATPTNFNSIGPGWYLNFSRRPNVRCDENLDFIAVRDIRAGEELTANYDEYSDPPTAAAH